MTKCAHNEYKSQNENLGQDILIHLPDLTAKNWTNRNYMEQHCCAYHDNSNTVTALTLTDYNEHVTLKK